MLWKTIELFWLVVVPALGSVLLAVGLALHLLGRLAPLRGSLRREAWNLERSVPIEAPDPVTGSVTVS